MLRACVSADDFVKQLDADGQPFSPPVPYLAAA